MVRQRAMYPTRRMQYLPPLSDHGNPVFRIKYPDSDPKLTDDNRDTYCGDANTVGFSTVLKGMLFGGWGLGVLFPKCGVSQLMGI